MAMDGPTLRVSNGERFGARCKLDTANDPPRLAAMATLF